MLVDSASALRSSLLCRRLRYLSTSPLRVTRTNLLYAARIASKSSGGVRPLTLMSAERNPALTQYFTGVMAIPLLRHWPEELNCATLADLAVKSQVS